MKKFNSFISLLRLRDQLLLIFAILIVNFFLSSQVNWQLLKTTAFIVSLTSFTFVINDLSDVDLDRLNKKTRNPIANNRITLKEAKLIAAFLLILTLTTSYFLPTNLIYYSIALIFISITYSFFIKAKSIPLLDLIYHGLGPTIGFLMFSSLYHEIDFSIIFASIIAFSLFSIIQLLQQVRDFDTDIKLIKTTATILGKKNTIKISIVLLASLILVLCFAVLTSVYPLKSVIYIPLSYLLFEPLIKALRNKIQGKNLLHIFTKRLIIVSGIFFLLFLSFQ